MIDTWLIYLRVIDVTKLIKSCNHPFVWIYNKRVKNKKQIGDIYKTFLDFESAGVSSINGQRTNTNNDNRQNPNNVNPYANANAPPPPPEHRDIGINNNYPSSVNSGGYPAYPSNTGYSPQRPPSRSETDLGYPAYPTNNRSPVQPGYYPPPQPNYPAYPNYNDISKNNYNRPRGPYHRSDGLVNLPYLTLGLTNLLLLIIINY